MYPHAYIHRSKNIEDASNFFPVIHLNQRISLPVWSRRSLKVTGYSPDRAFMFQLGNNLSVGISDWLVLIKRTQNDDRFTANLLELGEQSWPKRGMRKRRKKLTLPPHLSYAADEVKS